MEDFAAKVIAAHQAGLAERQRREQLRQQQEEHKLNVQQAKLSLDTAKLQQALHERQIQAMTSGMPTGQSAAEQNIQYPSGVPGLPGPSTTVSTGIPPLGPNIPVQLSDGRTITVPGTNLEKEQATTAEAALNQLKMEAMKQSVIEQAKAPFSFHELPPGAEGIIGAGTPAERRVAGPAKEQNWVNGPTIIQPGSDTPRETLRNGTNLIFADTKEPVTGSFQPYEKKVLTPEPFLVNGKPDVVLRDQQGNFYDQTTKKPIVGRVTPYVAPRQAGEITPNAEANLVQKLNQQWESASKDVQLLYRANSIMDAGIEAARRGDLNAGAQAVLVTFQKFLDPTSVVRESEYARSGAGLAMADRIRGYVEKLEKGGAGVPLAELEKFATLGKEINNKLASEGTSLLSAEKNRITGIANRYHVPPELAIPQYSFAKTPGPPPPTTTKTGPQVGDVVSVKGKRVKITAIHPDGTFDGDPVK